jgi:hypothetical protein
MTKPLIPVLLSLSFLSVAIGWALIATWQVGLCVFLLLIPILILNKRKFSLTLNLALTLLIGLAAFGLWRGLNFPLAFAAVLCALAAWDLHGFAQRLAFASADDDMQRLERQHLLQLTGILSLGAGLSLLSQMIHVVFNFEWAIVLALITFAGIGALVNWLKNKEETGK